MWGVNKKEKLLGLLHKHITSMDYFNNNLLVCGICKVELIKNVMQRLGFYCLNTHEKYTISNLESISAVKMARKDSTFKLP